MATTLSVYTKEEQLVVIRFLRAEGVPKAEIHRRLSARYEKSALSKRNVYELITMLKIGRTSVTDEEISGRLSTFTTEENVKRVLFMILGNRLVI
jgi:hypothetical protein